MCVVCVCVCACVSVIIYIYVYIVIFFVFSVDGNISANQRRRQHLRATFYGNI